MKPLAKSYLQRLGNIKKEIQASPELKQFLEDEEEAYYHKLQERYEKEINELYGEVADKDPLQLSELEKLLMDPEFEGLFIPRLLGYSVLRAHTDENMKYVRPQEHFKELLLYISNSYYFDILKQRIGQSIQMGFALSSDIWITNLLDEVENKKVKQFLMSQKLDKYRDKAHRVEGYERYQRQFKTTNFQTTEFPTTPTEMVIHYGQLRKFLEYRIQTSADHTTYTDELLKVLENKSLQGTDRYMNLLCLVINFIYLKKEETDRLSKDLNDLRKKKSNFSEHYFELLGKLLKSSLEVDPSADKRVLDLLDLSIDDDLTRYYSALGEVALKGFIHDDAKEAVRQLYSQYDGLSTINDCLRRSILGQFVHVLKNLTEEEYPDYFELNKTFVSYMDIFDYQQFNQRLKEESIRYVRKLLKKYTDKRGKDYQDIKKFVIPTFQDFGFMKEKEVLELFKTRRKKKAASS